LRVVLDTCILKLETFPADNNSSALIYELARAGLIEAWVSTAILEEYADVLGDHPEFVAEIVESFPVCYPLTELSVIRHEPDNRFLECALAANAEFIVTVIRRRAAPLVRTVIRLPAFISEPGPRP
jgi:predicted nucleic acid-binding protein